MFLTIPFSMFYYIALIYGNFLLETLDTFPLLKDAYTQSRKLYENWISSWYGALQQMLNNTRNTQQNTTKLGLCLQVSYVESIKKWRKITTTTTNQIQSWPFIYKPGEHRQQFKGEKNTKLRAQWVRPNASEEISVWNCCNAPTVLVAGSTGLFNKPNSVRIWCNGR